MPIYDFRCRVCGRVSEIFSRDASEVIRCPSCGSLSMEKLISASYVMKTDVSTPGTTCCGKVDRCETPPCSTGGKCRKD